MVELARPTARPSKTLPQRAILPEDADLVLGPIEDCQGARRRKRGGCYLAKYDLGRSVFLAKGDQRLAVEP